MSCFVHQNICPVYLIEFLINPAKSAIDLKMINVTKNVLGTPANLSMVQLIIK